MTREEVAVGSQHARCGHALKLVPWLQNYLKGTIPYGQHVAGVYNAENAQLQLLNFCDGGTASCTDFPVCGSHLSYNFDFSCTVKIV